MTASSTFWDYSLAFYAQPEVAQACLTLQDEAGCDVNVLLYLLFLADQGRWLDDADLARIDVIANAWREAVVAPLRGVRRRLKTTVGAFEPPLTAALRAEIKRLELAAERLQQETLERLAPARELGVAAQDRASCARNNLALYAKQLKPLPTEALAVIQNAFKQP